MAEFQKESLTLEETNRVRISLGLKPLEADPPTDASQTEEDQAPASKSQAEQDKEALANYTAQRQAAEAQAQEVAIQERLAKAKNRRDLARQLRGPTLGDATETAASTSARDWVKAARKRAQENADRRLREQEELEQQAAQQRDYSASDLQGLRVAHDLDELAEGAEERILTLRDANVLGEDEDELIEAGLDAAARDREKRERAKKPKAYTGLDDDEFLDGPSRGVLDKYDHVEGLDARGSSASSTTGGFRLGDVASVEAMDARSHARQEAQRLAEAREKQKTHLDYEKNLPVSDYDVSFKKKKSKKKRATRIKVEEDEDVELPSTEAMAVDAPAAPPARAAVETLIDDDELAASLARTRRQRAKQSFAKTTPAMIARHLAAQREAEAAASSSHTHPDGADEEGLTFDETSEFVRQIVQRPPQEEAVAAEVSTTMPTKASTDVPLPAVQGMDEEEAAALNAAATTMPSTATAEPLLGSAPTSPPGQAEDDNDNNSNNEDEEAMPAPNLHSGGVAGALSMLRSQGLLETVSAEQLAQEQTQKQYDAWLRARRKEEQRHAREASHLHGAAAQAHERDTRQREWDEAQAAMDRFKDYKPDVKIEYHDEFGRTLTTKEAWKRLSHTFHGNAPGHKAQEKRLRRIAEEQRRERMLAGDTGALTRAFQARSERTGQAHMVLSVGQKDHAPQDIDLGAPPALEKAPPARPAKPKGPPADWQAPPPAESMPPAAEAVTATTTTTPSPPPATEPVPPPKPGFKPAMKPAFAPVASTPAPSSTTTSAPRDKVRISLGKRKAD